MKIEIIIDSEGEYRGSPVARVSHGDQPSLEWDVSIYSKSRTLVHLDPMFDELNAYLATIPADRQDAIYSTYKYAREEQSRGYSRAAITTALQGVAKTLYELIPFQEIQDWVNTSLAIKVPDGVKLAHGPDDPVDALYRDRTYLVSDYMGLVALGVADRAMMPIWGEFLKTARDASGNINKEREGMRLLFYSGLVGCEPMTRLERYIEATTNESQKAGPSAASVMGGAGSVATPEILQAVTVVRRLAVCDLTSLDGSVNIITNVYQFILYNLRGMDRKFGARYGGSIADKDKISIQKDESNDSRMELLRLKESVPASVGVKKNVYSENIASMVAFVDPTIPMTLVHQCAGSIKPVDFKLYKPMQVFLMQTVLGSSIAHESPALSARGLPLMNQKSQNNAASVTQAALWHWGFPQLAAFLTAEEIQQDHETLGVADPLRYNRQSTELLTSLFPYERTLPKSRTKSRFSNVGQRVIEAFSVEVRRPMWRLHAPTNLIELVPAPQTADSYEFVSTIRDEMISLFLKINSQ